MRERELQDRIVDRLGKEELFPGSVIFTYAISDGLLSISFYIPEQVDDFLVWIDYKSDCDKSGYTIFRESNTIILTGLALIEFCSML